MVDDTTQAAPPQDTEASTTPQADFPRGALCAEAQADGVPCTELGRTCETCEKATQKSDESAW